MMSVLTPRKLSPLAGQFGTAMAVGTELRDAPNAPLATFAISKISWEPS